MSLLRNPRHEQFAQLVAGGKTPSEAYVCVGFSTAGASASAARLLRNALVNARVEELQQVVAQAAITRAAVDRAFVLNGLKENYERAMQQKPVLDSKGNETGQYVYAGGVANRALELIGKELGMFIDRSEHRVEWDGDPSKLTAVQLNEHYLKLAANGDQAKIEEIRHQALVEAGAVIDIEPVPLGAPLSRD